MQHQYWLARQSVLRRLGSREDECIVASDAELDAKLELFRSVAETSAQLQRQVEQLSERAATLAAEEAALGGLMREAGGVGGAAGRALTTAGRGLAACGQQRGGLRAALARLQRELDTFRACAVVDTRHTLRGMEKARADYRAALSWMKAASSRLDPDTGKGLHQFRKAQAQVRDSKGAFDKLALDCLQKVDLLAAARCNMFSHALVHYQNSLLNFSSKACHTLSLTAQGLSETPTYDFCILKELSDTAPDGQSQNENAIDKDQLLFFQDEFKDEKEDKDSGTNITKEAINGDASDVTSDLIDCIKSNTDSGELNNINPDLAGLSLNNNTFEQIGSFMPSQLLQDLTSDLSFSSYQTTLTPQHNENPIKESSEASNASNMDNIPSKKQDISKKDRSMWFKLFSELDPLANPDAMPGINNANQSHAA